MVAEQVDLDVFALPETACGLGEAHGAQERAAPIKKIRTQVPCKAHFRQSSVPTASSDLN